MSGRSGRSGALPGDVLDAAYGRQALDVRQVRQLAIPQRPGPQLVGPPTWAGQVHQDGGKGLKNGVGVGVKARPL